MKTCTCVDYLNFNPDPVANPDCPVHGILHKLSRKRHDRCPKCSGSGVESDFLNLEDRISYKCKTCNGTGTVNKNE